MREIPRRIPDSDGRSCFPWNAPTKIEQILIDVDFEDLHTVLDSVILALPSVHLLHFEDSARVLPTTSRTQHSRG